MQDRELGEQLTASLGRLPEQEAGVFCLRYLNGMSYRQIAKEMNIGATYAGVLLHRARTKLRRMLTGDETNAVCLSDRRPKATAEESGSE